MAKPCSRGEQEEGGGAAGRPSYLHLGTSVKQAWLPTKHRARAAPSVCSAWTWIQEQCFRLLVLKPMARDDALSLIDCVQTPMASAGIGTHLARITLDFCSPSCQILPETKLLWGAEDGEGETQTGGSQGKGCSVFLSNQNVRQQKTHVGEHHHSLDWPSFCESPPWEGEN